MALLVLSPFLLGLALLLRLRQGPPVLYRQLRPGLGGTPFTIYKFRTMATDTTNAEGEELADAQRTTRLGETLRSLSLDELPELLNVVKGDMSLVGPRPLLVEYLPRYTPEQARRHDVRPGLTGLAQVSGRNAITWEQRFALDTRYVDEHGMRMDIEIIVRTIGIVLSREGIRHSDDEYMPWFLGTEASDSSGGSER
jgi:lipopolysaccharide/colanic/teichoic acid biosynthesis glycosyltransferase